MSGEAQEQGDPLVRLARDAIEAYVPRRPTQLLLNRKE